MRLARQASCRIRDVGGKQPGSGEGCVPWQGLEVMCMSILQVCHMLELGSEDVP